MDSLTQKSTVRDVNIRPSWSENLRPSNLERITDPVEVWC